MKCCLQHFLAVLLRLKPSDPMVGGLAPVNADVEADTNPDKIQYLGGNAGGGGDDVWSLGTGRSSRSEANAASQ